MGRLVPGGRGGLFLWLEARLVATASTRRLDRSQPALYIRTLCVQTAQLLDLVDLVSATGYLPEGLVEVTKLLCRSGPIGKFTRHLFTLLLGQLSPAGNLLQESGSLPVHLDAA